MRPQHQQSSPSRRDQLLAAFKYGELAEGTEVALFAPGSSTPLDAAGRADLIQRIGAGEYHEIELEAVTFLQVKGKRNRRGIRVAPGALSGWAKSYKGQPMLRDHGQWSTDDRGGTVLACELVRTDDGATVSLRMRMVLKTSWATIAALQGLMDRWSVGLYCEGEVRCTAHKGDVRKCGCWPGDMIGDEIVEWEYQAPVFGVECSWVNVPAVTGTHTETIKALAAAEGLDLDALAGILGHSHITPRKVHAMDEEIIKELGLTAGANAADVVKTIRAIKLEATTSREALTLATERATGFERRATAAEELLGTERKASAAKEVDDAILSLVTTGKIAPKSKSEEALRAQGSRDLALFRASVAEYSALPPVTPAGKAPQSKDGKPAAAAMSVDEVLAADPELAASLSKAGITPAQFAKHGLAKYLEAKGLAAG